MRAFQPPRSSGAATDTDFSRHLTTRPWDTGTVYAIGFTCRCGADIRLEMIKTVDDRSYSPSLLVVFLCSNRAAARHTVAYRTRKDILILILILIAGRRSVEETSHQSVEETSHGPVARSRLPVEIFRLHKMQHPKQCLRQPFRRIFVAFFDSCLTSKRKFDSSGLAAFADCLTIHSRHL